MGEATRQRQARRKRGPLAWLRRMREAWQLRHRPIPDALWFDVTARLPLLEQYDAVEKARLRVLATLFLQRKSFTGARGIEVTPEMELIVAAQACALILELGIDSFDGWHSVIIYPDTFVVEHEQTDEFGLVHEQHRALSGESWSQGPVILSWDDVEYDSFTLRRGYNVVLHEFAHKLDMLNGRANGMPPLHPDMPIEEWTESLSRAYEHLVSRVEYHHGDIDPYAATDPAEFFAVICEYFFTAPDIVHGHYPAVYRQLRRYFRQDPLTRIGAGY